VTDSAAIGRWLERLARGDLTGGAESDGAESDGPESDGAPEHRRLLELLGRAQQRWISEREATLGQVADSIHQTVELQTRDQEHRVARARLGQRLRQTERMVAVGRLVAGVAHELNNPLTFMLGNVMTLSDIIAEPGLLPGSRRTEVQGLLGEVRGGAERIRRIVGDLRQYSLESGSVKCVAVDLRAVVQASIQQLPAGMRQRVRIVERHDSSTPPALANDAGLRQVLVNVLVNAIEAVPGGDCGPSEVRVTTRPGESDTVVVEVADDGVGIPADALDRIFEPFFTTKDIGQGTGLGLSVSQGLLEAMGGRMEVSSEPGRGTRFRLIQPRATDAVVGRPAAPAEGLGDVRKRILVIDDEPLILRVLERTLRRHAVVVARSGGEALEMLQDDREFDVVLCDVMMPEMSGIALYEHCKDREPEIAERFVFMTGGAFDEGIKRFLAGGERPCLYKPLERALLFRVIDNFSTRTMGLRA